VSATRYEVLRRSTPAPVSRFLSRFLADCRVFTENTTVVTNPTQGAEPFRHTVVAELWVRLVDLDFDAERRGGRCDPPLFLIAQGRDR
jgi:hypothetical protein